MFFFEFMQFSCASCVHCAIPYQIIWSCPWSGPGYRPRHWPQHIPQSPYPFPVSLKNVAYKNPKRCFVIKRNVLFCEKVDAYNFIVFWDENALIFYEYLINFPLSKSVSHQMFDSLVMPWPLVLPHQLAYTFL